MKNQFEIERLESLIPIGVDINKKYFNDFSKNAVYLPHGFYLWKGNQTKDPRLTFLKGCLDIMGINY